MQFGDKIVSNQQEFVSDFIYFKLIVLAFIVTIQLLNTNGVPVYFQCFMIFIETRFFLP